MIKIQCFTVNPLGENCYIASDHTGEGVIIDCGAFGDAEFQLIADYVEKNGILLKHALQTHMHFDHIFGLNHVFDRYGLRPECHEEEEKTYEMNPQLAYDLCRVRLTLPEVALGDRLCDNQEITFGETVFKAIHTPGHTPGGLCFYCEAEGVLFSGDTLFQGSVGRTDPPLGSWRKEIESVTRRILTLPDSTTIYPGHGDPTTVGYEKKYNPFLV